MKSCKAKLLIFLICSGLIFALIPGCESGSSKAKEYQLVAMELSQKLQETERDYQNKLMEQKKDYEKQLDQQKKELQKCQKAKSTFEQISSQGIDNYMRNIVGPLAEENQELKKKVKQLQVRIEELETELENMK